MPGLAKRHTADYIFDGSFELVPDRVAGSFEMNVRSGGWLVRNRAIFNRVYPFDIPQTQDGRKQVVFFSSGRQTLAAPSVRILRACLPRLYN